MDIEQLKSEDEQMEMMMMMMQMDKISELYAAYNVNDVSELPLSDDFCSGATSGNSNSIGPHYVDNNISSSPSPSLMNLPSTISFTHSTPTHQSNPNPNPVRGRSSSFDVFSSPSQKRSSMAAMREMIFRIAAMQPIHIDPEAVKPPKRRNVKISKDPQSVAARHRRERISERIRILQRLVPGGTKMDTASMLDEAIHYVKFLKTQVQSLERAAVNRPSPGIGFPVAMSSGSTTNYLTNSSSMAKAYQAAPPHHQTVQHFGDASLID